jgi:tRNA U34 5-methylaminomethyl-2-thiouridine-forming methyltransferase MnmC
VANDLLAEIVADRTRRNPQFPELVAEAEVRRKLARKLAALREKKRSRRRSLKRAWARRRPS